MASSTTLHWRSLDSVFAAISSRAKAVSICASKNFLAVGLNTGSVYVQRRTDGADKLVAFEGQTGPITKLLFRPDRNILAVGTKYGRLILLQLADDFPRVAEIRVDRDTLRDVHKHAIVELCWDPINLRLLSCDVDGEIVLTSLEDAPGGLMVKTYQSIFHCDSPIVQVDIHSNQLLISTLKRSFLLLLSSSSTFQTTINIGSKERHEGKYGACFDVSSNGQHILAARPNGRLVVAELSGKVLRTLVFSLDDSTDASVSGSQFLPPFSIVRSFEHGVISIGEEGFMWVDPTNAQVLDYQRTSSEHIISDSLTYSIVPAISLTPSFPCIFTLSIDGASGQRHLRCGQFLNVAGSALEYAQNDQLESAILAAVIHSLSDISILNFLCERLMNRPASQVIDESLLQQFQNLVTQVEVNAVGSASGSFPDPSVAHSAPSKFIKTQKHRQRQKEKSNVVQPRSHSDSSMTRRKRDKRKSVLAKPFQLGVRATSADDSSPYSESVVDSGKLVHETNEDVDLGSDLNMVPPVNVESDPLDHVVIVNQESESTTEPISRAHLDSLHEPTAVLDDRDVTTVTQPVLKYPPIRLTIKEPPVLTRAELVFESFDSGTHKEEQFRSQLKRCEYPAELDSLVNTILLELGALRTVELLMAVNEFKPLPVSTNIYSKLLRAAELEEHGTETYRRMLADAHEYEMSSERRYLDPANHGSEWGVAFSAQHGVCARCQYALSTPLSYGALQLVAFPCGHVYHDVCAPDRICSLIHPSAHGVNVSSVAMPNLELTL